MGKERRTEPKPKVSEFYLKKESECTFVLKNGREKALGEFGFKQGFACAIELVIRMASAICDTYGKESKENQCAYFIMTELIKHIDGDGELRNFVRNSRDDNNDEPVILAVKESED